MINFDAEACQNLDTALRREWLETNHLGGFASATITGANARRYHGLLTAALRPPTGRVVLLSKLEETLVLDGERHELCTNLYEPSVVHPQGFRLQTGFRLDPFPVFTYQVGDARIEKTVFMPHGENATVVRYRVHAPGAAKASLEIRPLVAFRDYHALQREAPGIFLKTELQDNLVSLFKQDDGAQMFLAHDAGRAAVEGYWYRRFEYPEERARGFDFHEDLFNPCLLVWQVEGDTTCDIIASTRQQAPGDAATFEARERERRRSVVAGSGETAGGESGSAREVDDYIQTLVSAADQFLVRRGDDLTSLIAGYHWFTDWGRDTMISLTGLAFARKQFDAARGILLAFAAHMRQGVIPNRFPDGDNEPEYNNVDGTLWFVNAVGEFVRRTGDIEFVREHLYARLKEFVEWHERGTVYSIRVEQDGLLSAGQADVQLTWMDAKIGDYVVTPRAGKAVEIQALWYNALRTVEEIAARVEDEWMRNHSRALAELARASFHGLFWNEADNYLYDCINLNGEPDASIRPNQIFALSLPHPIMTGTRALSVVEIVRRELLTPYGLRSLSPRHRDYRPRYEGDSRARDTAYHQGTVWAWLIGPFVTAYLRTHGRTPASVEQARGFLRAFREHLKGAGVGQVSEIFDGDAPHTPRGCIAQAWSVAELLRCELEELKQPA
ncbi:MAG TPA: amylo-alpha-1,6-glucosidase [Pyrinomonadaceae bacterium]|jgi:predicted glycogen debranching enzyme|nr:amylo-alpha-1,6-glucosidase [Pyrinomonadaceae bacterium]